MGRDRSAKKYDTAYSEYERYRHSLKEKVEEETTKLALKILLDERVYNEGVRFASKLFYEPQTQDAAIILLKNGVPEECKILFGDLVVR